MHVEGVSKVLAASAIGFLVLIDYQRDNRVLITDKHRERMRGSWEVAPLHKENSYRMTI